MDRDYLHLAIFWLLYLGSHSFFASNAVKIRAQRFLGRSYRYYRVAYVFIYTVALLIPGFIIDFPMEWIYRRNIISASSGIVLAVWGIMIIRLSFRDYSLREFTGFDYLEPKMMNEKEKLITSGILAKIRHPLYSATFLIAAGIFFIIPSVPVMISVICVVVYTFIGVRLEEHKLILQFGQSYLDYKKQVPMLIPRLFLFNPDKKSRNK